MKIAHLHRWDVTFSEAVALQRQLAGQVKAGPALTGFTTIAGADVSYNRFSPTLYACVVVLRMPDLTVIEERTTKVKASFPYRTGLLSFRETPVLLSAFRRLRTVPDVVMIDGHGLAHPRRMGIASHLGICLGIPVIGCAKSRLVGEFDDPDIEPGSMTSLQHRDAVIGAVLRSRRGCRPLFVSVGNRIDLQSSLEVVRKCLRGYRIPEPTRLAHERVNAYRRRCMMVKSEHE